jgi:hypothetical protein
MSNDQKSIKIIDAAPKSASDIRGTRNKYCKVYIIMWGIFGGGMTYNIWHTQNLERWCEEVLSGRFVREYEGMQNLALR